MTFSTCIFRCLHIASVCLAESELLTHKIFVQVNIKAFDHGSAAIAAIFYRPSSDGMAMVVASSGGMHSGGGAGAGPRAKRSKMRAEVQEKDQGGAMDAVELSQLVRDLCRQHELDRATWQETIDSLNDHAKKIDVL